MEWAFCKNCGNWELISVGTGLIGSKTCSYCWFIITYDGHKE